MSNLTLSIAVLREDIFLLAYSYRLLLLAVIVLLATLVLNYQTSCQSYALNYCVWGRHSFACLILPLVLVAVILLPASLMINYQHHIKF